MRRKGKDETLGAVRPPVVVIGGSDRVTLPSGPSGPSGGSTSLTKALQDFIDYNKTPPPPSYSTLQYGQPSKLDKWLNFGSTLGTQVLQAFGKNPVTYTPQQQYGQQAYPQQGAGADIGASVGAGAGGFLDSIAATIFRNPLVFLGLGIGGVLLFTNVRK